LFPYVLIAAFFAHQHKSLELDPMKGWAKEIKYIIQKRRREGISC
jgi:hypothetical protein